MKGGEHCKEGCMDKRERAVLEALARHRSGLLRCDLREATRREVSAHTVQEQLDVLLQRGHIAATAQQSVDRRVKELPNRYTITASGQSALEMVGDELGTPGK